MDSNLNKYYHIIHTTHTCTKIGSIAKWVNICLQKWIFWGQLISTKIILILSFLISKRSISKKKPKLLWSKFKLPPIIPPKWFKINLQKKYDDEFKINLKSPNRLYSNGLQTRQKKERVHLKEIITSCESKKKCRSKNKNFMKSNIKNKKKIWFVISINANL